MRAVGPCIRGCGRPATQWHHVTGRGANREQLDNDCVLQVCDECHDLIHEELRFEGVHYPLLSTSALDRVERRLRRLAINVARIADNPWVMVLALLVAPNLIKCADELATLAKRLDRWNPAWRDVADPAEWDDLRAAPSCDPSLGATSGATDQEGDTEEGEGI